MVLLGTVTAASACPVIIDVKPYSCPNPINLKNNGVMTIALNGSALIQSFGAPVEELGLKVEDVYLQKSPLNPDSPDPNRYVLDFNRDATRVVFEDTLIKPCCGGESQDKDGVSDVLIKIKDLNYNGANPLLEGEYYLYVRYTVNPSYYKWSTYTMSDCVSLMY